MDSSLRLSLHSSPSFSAALRSHRAASGRVWLEQAATFGDSPGAPAELARIRLCCAASPLPVSVTLTTGADGTVTRAAASCAKLPPASRPVCSALEEVALLCKALSTAEGAAAAWPPWAHFGSPLLRGALVAGTVSAVSSMARQWAAASRQKPTAGAAVAAALEGIVASAALLGTAASSPRAPVICDPLPPSLVSGAARRALGADAAIAQLAFSLGDAPFDAPALSVALRGVAALRRCVSELGALGETAEAPSQEAWGASALALLARALDWGPPPLPIETLVLLHWLAVLAPVYVLPPPLGGGCGAAPPALSGGAALRRYSVHAGLPLEPSEGGGARLPVPAKPAWDSRQLAAHGVLCSAAAPPPATAGLVAAAAPGAPAPLLHGTPAENGFRILQAGLRSQSGTRHEASGAMVRAACARRGAASARSPPPNAPPSCSLAAASTSRTTWGSPSRCAMR